MHHPETSAALSRFRYPHPPLYLSKRCLPSILFRVRGTNSDLVSASNHEGQRENNLEFEQPIVVWGVVDTQRFIYKKCGQIF